MYQGGKVSSHSVAFSHKVCRDNTSNNYSFVAEMMWAVIKKGLIFSFSHLWHAWSWYKHFCWWTKQFKITRAWYQTSEVGVAFLHLQQGRDNNNIIIIITGAIGVNLIQGHTGSRAAPAWNDSSKQGHQQTTLTKTNPCVSVVFSEPLSFTWSQPVMDDSDLFVHGAISAPL